MVGYVKLRQTRASDLRPEWHVIDAEGKTLGRLCSEIAVVLQGKHKPIYVPNLNTGDFVIVVNAGKIRVTGAKLKQKIYYRHSGYHGGLKERTLAQILDKTPTRAIKHAVKGMLPKSKLGRRMLSRLKLYAGSDHPHAAQVNVRPKPLRDQARLAPEPSERKAGAVGETAEAQPPVEAIETGAAKPVEAEENPPETGRGASEKSNRPEEEGETPPPEGKEA